MLLTADPLTQFAAQHILAKFAVPPIPLSPLHSLTKFAVPPSPSAAPHVALQSPENFTKVTFSLIVAQVAQASPPPSAVPQAL
jgi:hypothetical protein